MRTPEQKSRKMLNEEMTIMGLEMAIKKEQFRIAQKPKLVFHEMLVENKVVQSVPISDNGNDVKISNVLNTLLNKIGF